MNKFLRVIVSLAVTAATAVVAIPAQAVPSTPTSLPSGFTAWGTKSLGTDAFVYGDLVGSGTEQLVGYTVHSNGDPISTHIFEDVTGKIARTSAASFTFLKDGTSAFTWTTTNSTSYDSVVKVAFTDRSGNWGNPIQATPVFVETPSSCSSGCGYWEPRIAQDPKGRIAISFYAGQNQDAASRAVAGITTSTNKTSWATPTFKSLPLAAMNILRNAALVPLPAGGFSVAFDQTDLMTNSTQFWTAFLASGKKVFSGAKTVTDSRYPYTLGELVQASSTKYYRLISAFDPTSAPGQLTMICYQSLNTASKVWSSESCLSSRIPGATTGMDLARSTNAQGNVAIFFGSSKQSTNTYQVHELDINFGTLSTTDNIIATPSNAVRVAASYRNDYGQPVLIYDMDYHVYQAPVVDGTLGSSDTLFSTLAGNDNYFSDLTLFNRPVLVRDTDGEQARVHFFMADSKPILDKASTISGKNKVGSTLKASYPEFNSPNGYGESPGQWYSCAIKMTWLSYDFVPPICSAIPGATAATYKLKKADKGSFIAYQMWSHNSIGGTQVLSATTAKIG